MFFMLALVALFGMSFLFGQMRAARRAQGEITVLHSRPVYHGFYAAIWCAVPALVVLLLWFVAEPYVLRFLVTDLIISSVLEIKPSETDINFIISSIHRYTEGTTGLTLHGQSIDIAFLAERYAAWRTMAHGAMAVLISLLAIGGFTLVNYKIKPDFRARNRVESSIKIILVICSLIAILTTIGIVLSLVFEALRFFTLISPADFLFGLQWSPQIALRDDQVANTGLFGAIPLLAGTILISFIALLVAAPVGLASAVYMGEYASPSVRAVIKPLLEILAGVPTVVYGFFAVLVVAPFFRETGAQLLGMSISSESALAAGLVMGIMLIPFVSSLSDDVIKAVPHSLREGSMALGATRSETIWRVVLPAAFPGVIGSLLLATSRAIGETMIVVMAAGLSANLTANPFEAVTTVTVQIVILLIGDQEFDSAKTLAAFVLGLLLFCVTLALNVIALHIVQKYREKYD